MKMDDIIKAYPYIDRADFHIFLDQNNIPHKDTFLYGIVVEDNIFPSAIQKYLQLKHKSVEDEEREREEAARKKKAMAEIMISSGFNFDGYRIVKYSGYISGDDAISVPRGLAIFSSGDDVKDKLMSSLVTIRRNALRELKEAAYELGCNAVIGVDFDYLTLDPQTANLSGGTIYQPYVFGVTANGNAVIIEKIEE